LDSSHRKKQLHEWIIKLIKKASDEQIQNGIIRWFFFGDIDELIEKLQTIYDENIT
jgi:hypothetical protein